VRVPPARACSERRTLCSASPPVRQTASFDRPTQDKTPCPKPPPQFSKRVCAERDRVMRRLHLNFALRVTSPLKLRGSAAAAPLCTCRVHGRCGLWPRRRDVAAWPRSDRCWPLDRDWPIPAPASRSSPCRVHGRCGLWPRLAAIRQMLAKPPAGHHSRPRVPPFARVAFTGGSRVRVASGPGVATWPR